MLPAFTEAVRATTQPCTLLLIAPPLFVVLATRGRWMPLVGALVGAVVGGWLFMANVVALTDTQLRVSGLIAAGAVVVLIVAPYVGWLTWGADRRVQTGVAAGLAFLGTLWWRPCVGEELGVILTGAANDGLAGELLGMAAYMVGALVPVVIVALVVRAIDPSERQAVWLASITTGLAVMLGTALAFGHYDDLVETLTEWSQ